MKLALGVAARLDGGMPELAKWATFYTMVGSAAGALLICHSRASALFCLAREESRIFISVIPKLFLERGYATGSRHITPETGLRYEREGGGPEILDSSSGELRV